MDETLAVKSLAALAQDTRLRIFRALVVQGPQGLTPGQLSESLGVAGTALSFHLKELSHAGLVSQERNGRHLIYRADPLFCFLEQLEKQPLFRPFNWELPTTCTKTNYSSLGA